MLLKLILSVLSHGQRFSLFRAGEVKKLDKMSLGSLKVVSLLEASSQINKGFCNRFMYLSVFGQ